MDLFVPGMDLIVGRQRTRWGTSDEYNVIDNLNPVDYANLYSFDPDYFVMHDTDGRIHPGVPVSSSISI